MSGRWQTLCLLVAWTCLGMLRMATWQHHPQGLLKQRLSDEPQRMRLHGIISDDPATRVLPYGQSAQLCVIDLRHIRRDQQWRPIQGRVRATFHPPTQSIPPDEVGRSAGRSSREASSSGNPIRQGGGIHEPRPIALQYGDEVLLEGWWFSVPPPGNPGQYDWRAALARRRIHGLCRVAASDSVVVLRRHRGAPWYAAAYRLRHRWEQLINGAFAPRDAGLLLSLLLGERVALDPHLQAAFTETGTIHLLVISGFNVGLIAALLELCCRLGGIPWRARLALSSIGLAGYMLLTGLQPPVVRATLMAWVLLGAYAIDRLISWPNTLAAAALAILWINPSQVLDPGFQLSFGAVASLLLFAAPWAARLEQGFRGMRPAWFRRYLAFGLSATSAVWVGLAPVLAWYFHLVAPISVIANLLMAPLMSALVIAGTGCLLIATLMPIALHWSHGILAVLLALVVRCVSWCHAIPGGCWYVPHLPAMVMTGYYGLVAFSMVRRRFGCSDGRVAICWMAAGVVWLWVSVAGRALEGRWLRLDVLDVGHGDCLILRTPRRHVLVIDTGTEAAGQFRVIPFLRHEGITTIDALLLTHVDADHLGGAIPLLEQFKVRHLLTNGASGDTMSAHRVRAIAAARGLDHVVVTAGMRIVENSSLDIQVLHPLREPVPGRAAQSNDRSVVLKVGWGRVSALLCGDLEERGIPWLLQSGSPLRATLLKVPHHGSRLHGAGEQLFATVHPQVALVSVGRLHHLPARETMAALQAVGARVHMTRDDGAIQVRTDGTRLQLRAFKHPGVMERVLVEPPQETRLTDYQRSR